MEKSKLRKVGMGLALAAVAGLVLYTVQAPAEAPKYQTAPVERTDIENTVLATGLLEGVKQVDVGAQVSGQLKSLKVKVGDKVKKGQWLAEIDPLVLQNTLRQAQVDEENLQAQNSLQVTLADGKICQVQFSVDLNQDQVPLIGPLVCQ